MCFKHNQKKKKKKIISTCALSWVSSPDKHCVFQTLIFLLKLKKYTNISIKCLPQNTWTHSEYGSLDGAAAFFCSKWEMNKKKFHYKKMCLSLFPKFRTHTHTHYKKIQCISMRCAFTSMYSYILFIWDAVYEFNWMFCNICLTKRMWEAKKIKIYPIPVRFHLISVFSSIVEKNWKIFMWMKTGTCHQHRL